MLTKFIAYRAAIEKYVIASKLGGSAVDGLYEVYKGKYANIALAQLKLSGKPKGTTIISN